MVVMAIMIMLGIMFLLGMGTLIAGIIVAAVKRKQNLRKRFAVIAIVLIVVGIFLLTPPVYTGIFVWNENKEDLQNGGWKEWMTEKTYLDMENVVKTNEEEINGHKRVTFEYEGDTWVQVLPVGIYGKALEDMETEYTPGDLRDEDAVLNIREKRSWTEILLRINAQTTVYRLKGKSGKEIMGTLSDVYCKKEDLDDVEQYYSNFDHYSFFVEGLRDLDAEEGERIGIDPKQMNDLKKLNWKEGALSEEDTYASCAWKSKDHIFWGKVRFVRQKEGIYICTDSAEQGSWYARLSDKSAEYYETLFKDYWKDSDWMDSVESEEKQISVEEMFQLSDEEMVDAMGSHLSEKADDGDRIDLLNKEERIVYDLWIMMCETGSDGFQGYLYYYGDRFEETRKEATALKMPIVAKVLQEVEEKFPNQTVPKDEEKRREILDESDIEFEEQDESIYDGGEAEIIDTLAEYIRSNKAHFS